MAFLGAAAGPVIGGVASGVAGSLITGKGKDQAGDLARYIVPENINTGNSNFNTITGQIDLDPSIRATQDSFMENISGFRDPINSAFNRYDEGLEELSGRADEMRAGFEGNQSAFRELTLNPVREAISTRRGALDTELNRGGVRGTFADQSRTNFELDSARTLSDTEAKIEDQRISKLGQFLDLDANILKSSLDSETGRVGLLAKLENMLLGVSQERFSQELALLGLPAALVAGKDAGAGYLSNAQGLANEANVNLAGDIFGLFGGNGNGGDTGPGAPPGGSETGGAPSGSAAGGI